MKKSGTRKVFEKSEVTQLKKDLCNMCLEMEYNTQIGREAIYQNDPQKVITVLKYLWTNKENEKMSNADKELMEQILCNLCKEISFVTGKPYLKVRKEIETILGEDKKVSN
jgi:RNA polymerase-interacting CarD/CdnL/TRCF family regulator